MRKNVTLAVSRWITKREETMKEIEIEIDALLARSLRNSGVFTVAGIVDLRSR